MFSKPPVWAFTLPTAVLLMAPFDILASLAMDIYLPVVPAMPEMLGTSPSIVQLTLSLYLVVLGVGQVVFGPLSDHIGRRPVVLGGAILFAAASFGLAVSSSVGLFLVFRLIQAIGASAALVATFATVRDVYGTRPEGVVIYGLFSSMLAFVPALGPISGAILDDAFGWRSLFVALGVMAVLALLQAVIRWPETRAHTGAGTTNAFRLIMQSPSFWTYTLGFSAAMGSFFVFLSISPRVLVEQAGYSELEFSCAFATVAVAMIITTRLAKPLVAKRGIFGSLQRGMVFLLLGALLLSIGQTLDTPSFMTFIVPMWVIAVGIVLSVSVTANGALREFGHIAGTGVALHFCVQSLITTGVGTLLVTVMPGDTAWPLVTFAASLASLVLIALHRLHLNLTQPA